VPHFVPSKPEMTRAQRVLENGGPKVLGRLSCDLLEALCVDRDLMTDLGPAPVKEDMIEAFITLVSLDHLQLWNLTGFGRGAVLFNSQFQDVQAAGHISQVVRDRNSSDIFLLISPFEQLSDTDVSMDPYCRYLELKCQLYYSSPSSFIKLILLQDLISHVSVCLFQDSAAQLMKPCLVILSLDCVSA
jgi:hypothetical protein